MTEAIFHSAGFVLCARLWDLWIIIFYASDLTTNSDAIKFKFT